MDEEGFWNTNHWETRELRLIVRFLLLVCFGLAIYVGWLNYAISIRRIEVDSELKQEIRDLKERLPSKRCL